MAKETMARGMEVARYATPYLARRSLADWPPSSFLRDSTRPTSRPYFSVVSSMEDAEEEDGTGSLGIFGSFTA